TFRRFPASFPTMPRPSCATRQMASVSSQWRAGACLRLSSPSKGRNSDSGVTNVRNVSSPHWRRWLRVESRCVVPFTSFAENEILPDGSRPPVWFALDESRLLAFFAGIWTRWTSVRKVKEGETTNDLFAFLTTEPNAIVAPIHAKAMPAILTTQEEIDVWMTVPAKDALSLQRPLPDPCIEDRGARHEIGRLAELNEGPSGHRF